MQLTLYTAQRYSPLNCELIHLDKRIAQLKRKRLRLLDEWFEKRSSFKSPETCQKMIVEIEDEILELRLKQFEI